MVAPIVAAGTRVAAGGASKKAGRSAIKQTGKAAARQHPVAKNRLARQSGTQQTSTRTRRYQRLRQQFTARGVRNVAVKQKEEKGRLGRELKRVRAVGIASAQSVAHLPFYGVQFCFALLYVVSVYLLDTPAGEAANWFIPLEFLSYIAWAMIFAIGSLSMFQAWMVFTAARVDVFHNLSFVFFGLLTMCYMIPYLGFLPLMIIWVWLVVLFQ